MSQVTRDFEALLKRMTGAICTGDGAGAAACFAPQGTYHDGFYGALRGRETITRMVTDFFHRDARDFEWRVTDVVCDGHFGYARYEFSYVADRVDPKSLPFSFGMILYIHTVVRMDP